MARMLAAAHIPQERGGAPDCLEVRGWEKAEAARMNGGRMKEGLNQASTVDAVDVVFKLRSYSQ